MQSLLYAGFSGFVFVTSLVARQQAQAREEQRRLNAELRATRALLAESARINERTRISRELHDLLGHHLTALSLNLEVAGHLTDGKAQEHVNQAHTLAKLLLSDVREAVSHLRDGDAIDMAATLLPLADHVPALADHDGHAASRSGSTIPSARTCCCAARRKSSPMPCATRRRRPCGCITARTDGWSRLQARDDGRGAEVRERRQWPARHARTTGGRTAARVDIQTAPGTGFALDIALPLDDGVASRRRRATRFRRLARPKPSAAFK